MFYQRNLQVATGRRGTYEITREIQAVVTAGEIETGLCHVFIQHTSASLIVCENADSTVRKDLEEFFARAAPDGDAMYQHRTEGPDDMSAHIRSVLTQTDLVLPIANRRLALGVWQGVFVYEHRYHASSRKVIVTAYGEKSD
ncbi:MAG: YjbQ family protein [Gammaproteobacteria bacterium]|nr:YjbQ family protein [Gammaproteobacteria bacterium]